MLAKTILAVLALTFVANASANIKYPAGMPSECIPYYTPPTTCPAVPSVLPFAPGSSSGSLSVPVSASATPAGVPLASMSFPCIHTSPSSAPGGVPSLAPVSRLSAFSSVPYLVPVSVSTKPAGVPSVSMSVPCTYMSPPSAPGSVPSLVPVSHPSASSSPNPVTVWAPTKPAGVSSVPKSDPSNNPFSPVGVPSAPATRSSTPVSVPSWSTGIPSSVPVSNRSTSSSVSYSIPVSISSTPARGSATPVSYPSGSAGGSPITASDPSAPTGLRSSHPANDPPTSVGRRPTAPTTTITVTTVPTATSISQCNSGGAQCCNSVHSASSSSASKLLGLVGAHVVAGADVLVGLGCTSLLGVGALDIVNCAQQPVCCSHNNFNGLVNIGCTPISL